MQCPVVFTVRHAVVVAVGAASVEVGPPAEVLEVVAGVAGDTCI